MAIYCDQTGYLPAGRKTAVMTAGQRFSVIREQGGKKETVLES